MKVTLKRIPQAQLGDVTKQIFRNVMCVKWLPTGVTIRYAPAGIIPGGPFYEWHTKLAPKWSIEIDEETG